MQRRSFEPKTIFGEAITMASYEKEYIPSQEIGFRDMDPAIAIRYEQQVMNRFEFDKWHASLRLIVDDSNRAVSCLSRAQGILGLRDR
jgi:hypothetical protein